MYTYRAKLDRVVDGDTVDLFVDLGFNIWIKDRFRLLDIDTPELRGGTEQTKAAARKAKEFVENLFGQYNNECEVLSQKDTKGKYGRWLATIILVGNKEDSKEVNLNERLIEAGLAERIQ